MSRLISNFRLAGVDFLGDTEKTIHDEETSGVDLAESMADLKVRCWGIGDELRLMSSQNKLEAQYAAKRQAHESEVQDLKQQLELKANEIRSLNTTIDGLKSVNEELKVCHFSNRWFVRQARQLSADTPTASIRCHLGWYRGGEKSCGERAGS